MSRRINEDQNAIYDLFRRNTRDVRSRVTELKGISWEMAEEVEDESLDFVFIDADHGYEAVKKDIEAWLPKVKPGGFVSGHDINLPGVFKAVVEAFGEKAEAAGFDTCWYTWKPKTLKRRTVKKDEQGDD
jgi:predicted O-methyltransferase YrrM